VGHAGARACQCSPVAVEEDEPDEAMPEGCSPGHERRRRGGAMEAKNGDGLSSARGSLGERRKGGGEGRGCLSPFIGPRERRGSNDWH
jgi:hypothetical protein